MAKILTSDLDKLVADVNGYGGDFQHPEFVARYLPLELDYKTPVNQELSPYSQEYYDQQVALYQEISGRTLNQEEGELHPIDIESLIGAPNPIGILDVNQMNEHVRSISLMMSLAAISGRAEVLDMGAGHGIASEIMAFCACKVRAVDIDPALSELSRRRAAARGLDIQRSLLNYDDLSAIEDGHYDAAFFSQSLHHCLRPWELIATLKRKLKPGTGVIGFVGEPINTFWWRNWGIRLDETSLYVARAHGWFESGWSMEFIRDCFERNGFSLTMFKGGFIGGGIGIATTSPARYEEVRTKGVVLGIQRDATGGNQGDGGEDGTIMLDESRYLTLAGAPATLCGRAAYRQDGGPGVLLYGPYVSLEPGSYAVSTIIEAVAGAGGAEDGVLRLEATADTGETMIWSRDHSVASALEATLTTVRFELAAPAQRVEFRAVVEGGGRWTVSFPTLKRLPAA